MIGYFTAGGYGQTAFAQLFAQSAPHAYRVYGHRSIFEVLNGCLVRLPEPAEDTIRTKAAPFADPMYLYHAPLGVKTSL